MWKTEKTKVNVKKQRYPDLDEDRCNKKACIRFKFIFQVWL